MASALGGGARHVLVACRQALRCPDCDLEVGTPVLHSGPPVARGHLRLAGPPAERRVVESRVALLARALAVTLGLAALTVVAWTLAALTMLPLVWRRAPTGVRLRPLHPREARIIPFERPRGREREALPR